LADDTGISFRANGWNAFAELKFLKKRVRIFGNYGIMCYDELGTKKDTIRQIVGIAYHIFKRNKVVLDLNRYTTNAISKGIVEVMFELAL